MNYVCIEFHVYTPPMFERIHCWNRTYRETGNVNGNDTNKVDMVPVDKCVCSAVSKEHGIARRDVLQVP